MQCNLLLQLWNSMWYLTDVCCCYPQRACDCFVRFKIILETGHYGLSALKFWFSSYLIHFLSFSFLLLDLLAVTAPFFKYGNISRVIHSPLLILFIGPLSYSIIINVSLILKIFISHYFGSQLDWSTWMSYS